MHEFYDPILLVKNQPRIINMDIGQYVRLADSRRLSFSTYGPESSQPVMFFHGMPGSRLDQPGNIYELNELDVRLIVPDRPGYGYSDFQEGRQLLDWPDDVRQLANHLDLDQFSLIGYSGGGPYAAACAQQIPDRLSTVALISSPAPFDAEGITPEMLPSSHVLLESAAADPDQTRQQLDAVAPAPEAMMAIVADTLSDVDKAVAADKEFQQHFLESLNEVYRQGLKGYVWDMSLLAQPWGFNLADIKTPITIWHGECDTNVPSAMGRYLSKTIPKTTDNFLVDAGHFQIFMYWKNILQTLINRS